MATQQRVVGGGRLEEEEEEEEEGEEMCFPADGDVWKSIRRPRCAAQGSLEKDWEGWVAAGE